MGPPKINIMSTINTEIQLTTKGNLLALLSGACFGLLGIFAQFASRHGLNQESLLAWRFILAAFFLFLYSYKQGQWRLPWTSAIPCLLLGAIGYALEASLYLKGVAINGAGITAVLLYLFPGLVTLLMWTIFREIPSLPKIMALLVALGGCILTCYDPQGAFQRSGILYGLASSLVYAIYLITCSRVLRKVNPLTAAAYIALGAAFSLGLYALFCGKMMIPYTFFQVFDILMIALGCTVIPILTLFTSIRIIGVAASSILSTSEPVVSLLLGLLIFQEPLSKIQLTGCLLILVSVIIIQGPFGRKEKKKELSLQRPKPLEV